MYGRPGARQSVGHYFQAIDIRAFRPVEEFKAEVDEVVRSFKAAERVPGVEEILMPGEPEARRREQSAMCRRLCRRRKEAGAIPNFRRHRSCCTCDLLGQFQQPLLACIFGRALLIESRPALVGLCRSPPSDPGIPVS